MNEAQSIFDSFWAFFSHPLPAGLALMTVSLVVVHLIPKFREVVNTMCSAPEARRLINKRLDNIESHLGAQDQIQDAILTAVAGKAVDRITKEHHE